MIDVEGYKLWWTQDKQAKNFLSLECTDFLKEATLIQCSITSLDGIDKFFDMQSVHLYYLRSLSDISTLEKCANSLRALTIESCPRVTDFSVLYTLNKLEHLNLMGSNVLPDLKFLEHMPNMKTFVWSMPVADCDLSPCLRLPYASYTRGKRGYNYKDRDLPHKLPTEPFTLK